MSDELTTALMAYEDGTLSDADFALLFQRLIDSGLVWRLQGHYGRTARDLIARGICRPPARPASK